MTGQITITLDKTQPSKTVSFDIANDQLSACSSFVRDQMPKYSGIGHLLAQNLNDGLFTQLVARYPDPTITALQAQLNSIQAQVAALLAASNPSPTPAPDPVNVPAF